jgi:hypothetical protein
MSAARMGSRAADFARPWAGETTSRDERAAKRLFAARIPA